MAGARLGFVTWASHVPSGGNTYNQELVTALRAAGAAVDVHELPGDWPDPSARDVARLAGVLRGHEVSLVDGIVASAAPAAVRGAVDAGCAVAVLGHMPIGDEVGPGAARRAERGARERDALRGASVVICTSHGAAAEVARRYSLEDVRVALPGVRPAPQATGTRPPDPPGLLALAALTPTKDQVALVRALARVQGLPWSARLVGPEGDPAYARRVRAQIEEAGLTARVHLTGAQTGADLEAQWAATDLLVLTSRTETYGLVVTEALSRGIPAIVPAGTGAVEALQAGSAGGPGERAQGRAVAARDTGALAGALREWLTDAGLREAWRAAARERRGRLPGWDVTAEQVLAHLAG
ncbi:glycosyltransferase family 4 protein [Georgenia sp. SYP-B2076]|uniref:glycosyltransferase family 4 protein n=1 Tax=Georgenia sp. SYP-B2076 TaxID=2495881 RepID=UPI001F0C0755|nr:glycosyltransferase family 4 protein [Georgenia sp. SYP-B2076]